MAKNIQKNQEEKAPLIAGSAADSAYLDPLYDNSSFQALQDWCEWYFNGIFHIVDRNDRTLSIVRDFAVIMFLPALSLGSVLVSSLVFSGLVVSSLVISFITIYLQNHNKFLQQKSQAYLLDELLSMEEDFQSKKLAIDKNYQKNSFLTEYLPKDDKSTSDLGKFKEWQALYGDHRYCWQNAFNKTTKKNDKDRAAYEELASQAMQALTTKYQRKDHEFYRTLIKNSNSLTEHRDNEHEFIKMLRRAWSALIIGLMLNWPAWFGFWLITGGMVITGALGLSLLFAVPAALCLPVIFHVFAGPKKNKPDTQKKQHDALINRKLIFFGRYFDEVDSLFNAQNEALKQLTPHLSDWEFQLDNESIQEKIEKIKQIESKHENWKDLPSLAQSRHEGLKNLHGYRASVIADYLLLGFISGMYCWWVFAGLLLTGLGLVAAGGVTSVLIAMPVSLLLGVALGIWKSSEEADNIEKLNSAIDAVGKKLEELQKQNRYLEQQIQALTGNIQQFAIGVERKQALPDLLTLAMYEDIGANERLFQRLTTKPQSNFEWIKNTLSMSDAILCGVILGIILARFLDLLPILAVFPALIPCFNVLFLTVLVVGAILYGACRYYQYNKKIEIEENKSLVAEDKLRIHVEEQKQEKLIKQLARNQSIFDKLSEKKVKKETLPDCSEFQAIFN